MRIEQRQWTAGEGWRIVKNEPTMSAPQLVLIFGAASCLQEESLLHSLKERYPNASLLGCSTAGEISGTQVFDDSLVATAIEFEHSQVHSKVIELGDAADSFAAGKALASSLAPKGLVHAF